MVSLAVSVVVLQSERGMRTATATNPNTSTSLVAALLDDDGTYGLPSATTDAGVASDSNGVTP
ncbi:MAG: hypothetical protein U0704_11325 [Candidatus Eisenbacteria bacterium]